MLQTGRPNASPELITPGSLAFPTPPRDGLSNELFAFRIVIAAGFGLAAVTGLAKR